MNQIKQINMEKIISIVNWIVIAVLAFMVIMETLNPTKGGDAAGRGIGQAIYYLAIMGVIVLVILNLLPFKWAKYAGLAIIVLPFLLIKMDGWYTQAKKWMNQVPVGYNIDKTPWFTDPLRQKIAIAAYNAEVEKVKELLPQLGARINEQEDGLSLLHFLVMEHNGYEAEKRIEIMRLFFDAGASCLPQDNERPMQFLPASSGNAEVLKLLLEHGADPNALDEYSKRPLLFEAIYTYQNVPETVQATLDAGANPNATFDYGDEGDVSALMYAALVGRWNICPLLIAKGADINYTSPAGITFRSVVEEADSSFTGDGYSTRADYERVKAVVLNK